MPVYAVESGTVLYAGAADGYGGPDPCGWLVVQGDGGTWEYGHIIRLPNIGVGSKVVAGQQIALVNPDKRTNGGTDPHLHVSYMSGRYDPARKSDPIVQLRNAKEPHTVGATPGWTGDPVWLEDVLRPALGKRLKTLPGWKSRGHGDFKDIRGILWHHTGNAAESAESIARGRSDLPGPLSNIHIAPDGTVTIVAVGVCWHAGAGSYPWLPTNMGNWHLLGVECAWPRNTSLTPATAHRERWPDAQIVSMRDVAAAITLKLGFGPERNICHKEWAGVAQGKWDPGNFDPSWFRGEVEKDMRGKFDGKLPTPTPVKPVAPVPGGYAHILLYPGMSGPAVKILQARLQKIFSKIALDGKFGPHTEACVRAFQKNHNLPIDGVVGPATAAAMQLQIPIGA